MIDDKRTLLDVLKESVYYMAIGASALEDQLAVIAYNGKGYMNSRIFVLKRFEETPAHLRERLELLRGELNNRDGSAIRYAAHYLEQQPATTKFIFHLSDMKPSDREIEQERTSPGILSFPYEGRDAAEDVVHAYNTARTQGIVPVGICIQQERERKPTKSLTRGRINTALLEKIKKRNMSLSPEDISSRLSRLFKHQYHVIRQPQDLATILREVYLRLSFS
jgi:nitric oxide reductase activation protein